jgi:tripartite-type tricarboxylate transporter receptor subunit TctC
MTSRRQFQQQLLSLSALGATGALSSLLSSNASAQTIDQVKIYYGFPPGSAGDGVARRVAEKLAGSAYTKSAAIVENKPGAGGRIALETLKGAPADGSALAMSPWSALAVYPHIFSKLSYDPLKDFVPVSIAAIMHHGLAISSMVPESVKNVKDFLAWAKANTKDANYGSPGAGSTPHFIANLVSLQSGVEMKHVPYRGSVPGVADLVGGQIAAMCTTSGDFLQHHRTGKIRLIATTGKERSPFSPEVATFAEQGFPEVTTEEWFGFYAPAKTPPAIVASASAAINAALKEKSVIDSLAATGLIAKGSTPEEMARSQKAEYERWGPLVKRIGFTAES